VVALPPVGDSDELLRTRASWHALAEHVLAAARHRAAGRIGLRAVPGGFGTPRYEIGEAKHEVRVVGRELVVKVDAATSTHPITTLGAAAAAVGIEPGGPADVYHLATPGDPDAPLPIDDAAAGVLAAWYELGWATLGDLRADGADEHPSDVTLWPEHFDIGLDLGDEDAGARGTFGASPGDTEHAEPYLYVTHWGDVEVDPFWNDQAFGGASLSYAAVAAAADTRAAALAFYRQGRQLLNAARV
jgi:hypothetical protein